MEKKELTPRKGFIYVVGYLLISIIATLIASIITGPATSSDPRLIDGLVGYSMYANLSVSVLIIILLFTKLKSERAKILYEETKFKLSKLYYSLPIFELLLIVFILLNTDFSAYDYSTILLIIFACFVIAFNEEFITRGILLTSLRNSQYAEWKVWLITTVTFSLLHLVNFFGGGNVVQLISTLFGGTIYYVSRRVFGNIYAGIVVHALYDIAFFSFSGMYNPNEALPDNILDYHLASFLVSTTAVLAYLVLARRIFRYRNEELNVM